MLKSYAEKKILIMEKTTVVFISVASSFYHCFSFLGSPLLMSMLTLSGLRHPAPRLPGVYCPWLSSSVINVVTLHSAVRFKQCRAGQNPSWDWDYCFPSGCCCSEASGLSEQDGWWWWWVMMQCQYPVRYSLSPFPKASVRSLSSSISSPLCPLFARDTVCGCVLQLLI